MIDTGFDNPKITIPKKDIPRELAANEILQLIRSGKDYIFSDVLKIIGNYYPKRLATGLKFDYITQRIIDEEVFRKLGKNEKSIATKLRECMVVYLNEQQKKSRIDELTGIYRRGYFNQKLEEAIKEYPRQTIIIIDIDYFKQVNDKLGHSEGDKVLNVLAGMIHDEFNSCGLYGRYGGEEFIMAIPDKQNNCITRLNNLRTKFRNFCNLQYKGQVGQFTGTFSAGVYEADFNKDEISIETAFKIADTALYQAKKQKDTTVVWTSP